MARKSDFYPTPEVLRKEAYNGDDILRCAITFSRQFNSGKKSLMRFPFEELHVFQQKLEERKFVCHNHKIGYLYHRNYRNYFMITRKIGEPMWNIIAYQCDAPGDQGIGEPIDDLNLHFMVEFLARSINLQLPTKNNQRIDPIGDIDGTYMKPPYDYEYILNAQEKESQIEPDQDIEYFPVMLKGTFHTLPGRIEPGFLDRTLARIMNFFN